MSQLTWSLAGGDDNPARKRPGEFLGVKKPPQKRRQLGREALNGAALASGCPETHPDHMDSPQLGQRSNPKPSEELELLPARRLDGKISRRGLLSDQSSAGRVTAKNNTSVSDSDIDSEEEIRAMVKKETERQKAENVETEGEHLEIVGDNFELKYSSHWSLSNLDAMKKTTKGGNRETVECDNGYNSADTDEIIAESKTQEDSKQGKVKNKEILAKKKSGLVNGSSLKTCSLKEEHIERKRKIKKCRIAALQSTAANSTTETRDSDSSCSESEKGESEISSDYESMMQNCYRLDLTLDDLKALATENTETSAEGSGTEQNPCQSSVEDNPKDNTVNKSKLSKVHPAKKKAKKTPICPEDVLADILAGEEDAVEESSKGQNNSHLKYQPFRGMGSLCVKELSKDSTGLKKKSVDLGLEACTSCSREESSKNQPKNHPLCSPEVSSKKRHKVPCEQHEELSAAVSSAGSRLQPGSKPHLQGKNKGVSSLQDQISEHGAAAASTDQGGRSSDMDSDAAGAQHVKQQLKSPKLLSKTLKRNRNKKSPECEGSKGGNENTSLLEDKELCLPAAASKEPSTTEKQLQDNQRRLAALEERHRERELQKKLIQGALSNLVITIST